MRMEILVGEKTILMINSMEYVRNIMRMEILVGEKTILMIN